MTLIKLQSYKAIKLWRGRTQPRERSQTTNSSIANSLIASSRGMTLVETVVALALASIVLSAIVGMVVAAVSTAASAKSRTTATRYAEEGIEVSRRTRDENLWTTYYSTYVGNVTWHVDPNYNLTSGAGLSIDPFSRTITVTDASTPSGAKNRVQVVVRVTWLDKGKLQTVQLDTYLTEWNH